MHKLTPVFISSIDQIEQTQWNRLCGNDYPFLRYEFFAAMEHSGSTTMATGWQPHHLIMYHNNQVIAVFPLFIKHHSFGEYVFDWAWADAYHQHGLKYYPKLLNAIPFTPAGGPRWGIQPEWNTQDLLEQITHALATELKNIQASSCHCLFTQDQQTQELQQHSWLLRTGYQYHWYNHNYQNFDHY